MIDDTSTLSVGFEINFNDAFGQLRSLDDIVGDVAANAFREFKRIEQASEGAINMGSATAQMKAFGNAVTREMAASERATNRAEKAGEALVRQLERQSAAFGKTRGELRLMKAEAAAVNAEQQGLTKLAATIRATESELAGKELAAARRARFEAEALEEARAQAEAQAAIARAQERLRAERALTAQLQERNRLEAAIERNTGLGKMSATDQGATYSALAAKFAEDEARAQNAAAASAQRLATEHANLAAMVRNSHAAQMADAEAAERMRMATDPLYAATKRLNEEIAESTRLYYAGATGATEYARQQEVLAARQRGLTDSVNKVGTAAGKSGYAMTQFGFQLNDVATMAAMGAPPMQIFASQAGQIIQVFQMAEGGAKNFAKQIGMVALRFTPFIVAAAAGAYQLKQFTDELNDGGRADKFISTLGLTADEIKELEGKTVSFGDVALGTWDVVAAGIWDVIGPAVAGGKASFDDWFGHMNEEGAKLINNIIGFFVGGFNAIGAVWSKLPAAIGDIAITTANATIAAINQMIQMAVDGMNSLIKSANSVLPEALQMGTLTAPQFKAMTNDHAGAGKDAGEAFVKAYEAAQKDYWGQFSGAVGDASWKRFTDRMVKQADALKDKRPDAKPKVDRTAERLAREAEATESLIRDLYKLADAYEVSEAAALRQQIVAKATAEAIKKQADVASYVDRQIRLFLAQTTSDGAKEAAAIAAKTNALQALNDQVAAGTITSEQAQRLAQDEAQLRPYLTAMALAEGDAKDRLTKVVARLRGEQERSNKEALRAEDLTTVAKTKRAIDAIKAETALTERLGTARLEALNGPGGRTLEQALADINLEREKALILMKAEAEAADLLARGLPQAAAAALERAKAEVAALDVEDKFDRMEDAVRRANDQLRDMIGLMGNLGKVGSALGGLLGIFTGKTSAATGPIGELLNVDLTRKDKKTGEIISTTIGDELSKIFGPGSKFANVTGLLAEALKGAGTGMIAADIFGMKSTTEKIGAALGGAAGKALGTAIGGPLGGAIGSVLGGIAGGFVGGLFKKTKSGGATLTGAEQYSLFGNSGSRRDAAGDLAGSVFSGLDNIAKALGGSFSGGFNTTIGIRGKDYRVNTNGTSLKTSKGAVDFGQDAQAAIAFAIQDAIKDGALMGLRAGTQALLQKEGDFEVQLQKALAFEGVFRDLRAMTNPLIGGLEDLAAKGNELTKIFTEAGASAEEFAQLQEYMTKQQQALIDQISSTYRSTFFTDAENLALAKKTIKDTLAPLGKGSVDTVAEYKALVKATDALKDPELYGTLMELADEFGVIQDAADAAKEAAAAAKALAEAIAAQKGALEVELLKAQGKTLEATAKQREMELAAMDASLRPLQKQVWAHQDLAEVYERESAGLQETIDTFGKLGDTLREFRRGLYQIDDATGAYARRLAELQRVGGLASLGDKDAMGLLPGVGQDFLDAAKAQAISLQDYQRDVARVARYADSAIGAADGMVSEAQAQLDVLNEQVSQFIQLNETALSIEDALEAMVVPAADTSQSNQDLAERMDRMNDRLERLHMAAESGALASGDLYRFFRRMTRDGVSLATSEAT